MTCEDARALVAAYIDGELDVVHTLSIEKHLNACPACARIVENQRALRAAIQSGELRYEPAKALEERVGAALRGAAGEVIPRRRYQWPYIAIAAGILLAVLFAGRLVPGWRPAEDNLVAQEILDSHLRSLMPGHMLDFESTDQHTVKPWFNGKLDFSPPVENFAAQGYPLIGGRLDSVSGRSVAALIYQRRKHTINVYIWPSGGAAASGPVTTTRQGYNLMHWTEGSLNYWLASDLNAGELQAFANLFRSNAH